MDIVFPGGKKVHATHKGFTFMTDQPRDSGGDGSAPSPFDLFLASIGTCAGFYVLSFCQERAIPTDVLTLILQAEKSQKTGMVEKITIEIQLPLEFPEKYREAVKRAAEACAVKKHLEKPPTFVIYTSTTGAKAAAGLALSSP